MKKPDKKFKIIASIIMTLLVITLFTVIINFNKIRLSITGYSIYDPLNNSLTKNSSTDINDKPISMTNKNNPTENKTNEIIMQQTPNIAKNNSKKPTNIISSLGKRGEHNSNPDSNNNHQKNYITDPKDNKTGLDTNKNIDNLTESPIIRLISPKNNGGLTINKTDFKFQVRINEINRCSLKINNNIKNSVDQLQANFTYTLSTNLLKGKYNWSIDCYQLNNTKYSSQNRIVTVLNKGKLQGRTTDLSEVDITNITNMILEDPNLGLINFSERISLTRLIDYENFIKIKKNFVEIDSTIVPELNKSAIITLFNLEIKNPVVLRDGEFCKECSILNKNRDITFQVKHFTNYTISENSRLIIWDSTDKTRERLTDIYLFANYSNISDSSPISSATCNISINESTDLMTYNSTSKLFEYYKSINNTGTYQYSISCDGTLEGFTMLSGNDYVSIQSYGGPEGAMVQEINTQSGNSYNAENLSIYSGNLTELFINGDTLTASWQGYYGNISGGLVLKDGSTYIFYNWTSIIPSGEVYATRAYDVNFAAIGCADPTIITNEELFLNQNSTDSDSVSNTFSINNHPGFFTGTIEFTINQCKSTNINRESGIDPSSFYEVILADSASNVIYTSIIEKDKSGFNSNLYDFEMMVGENGKDNIAPTTYFFFMEIQ